MKDYRSARPPIPARVWRDPRLIVAFGLGSGLVPWAPGTFGTLVGVLLYWAVSGLPWWGFIAFYGVLTVGSVRLYDVLEAELGVHDHPAMVLDEVVAFGWVMLGAACTWQNIVLGFVLFRFFDIVKPWPIGWVDRNVQGGWGTVGDDLLAACYSALGVQLWVRFF